MNSNTLEIEIRHSIMILIKSLKVPWNSPKKLIKTKIINKI